ncbi:peptidase [Azospirillum brasilense]|uniref:Peptidase n=1 Tax=Azospirillum brasilense TaxID=192 RepID=A0A0N7I7J9_AZOBR|nr:MULTISPECIES: peptidase [Azospirillum]ALJ34699.1 peptidase [Azospirillum brasilense]MDW7554774.1 peptidase [Azospirillum brasilense]MDW7557197.1 peptidase [Azospirillum brasilense]MDW7593103.1 peptidase [Azospirillum brasilense]MDW7626946.1 peptidase [Azospirillum brasilense]
MTYCLGIKTRDGLIGLSDGRITSGSQLSSARKVTMVGSGGDRFFILNSGLRSVRDKTLAYLRRDMSRRRGETYPTMLDALSAFTACLRQVAAEDKESLEASKLAFNLHAIIGGQLAEDREPYMFLVYPEGNWIEVDERTPYLSIGATAYGKPILDRALSYNTDMQTALKIAYLSFDSTRFSSNDVGFPIDMVTFNAQERLWRQSNFDYDDLVEQRLWWNRNITELARRMPDGPWVDTLLAAGARADVAEEEVV